MLRFARLFVVKLWPWYLGGALCLAVTNIISLEIPQLAKELVNHLHEGLKPEDFGTLPKLALAIMGLGLAQIFIRSSSRILIFWPGRKLEASSKSYLFELASSCYVSDCTRTITLTNHDDRLDRSLFGNSDLRTLGRDRTDSHRHDLCQTISKK